MKIKRLMTILKWTDVEQTYELKDKEQTLFIHNLWETCANANLCYYNQGKYIQPTEQEIVKWFTNDYNITLYHQQRPIATLHELITQELSTMMSEYEWTKTEERDLKSYSLDDQESMYHNQYSIPLSINDTTIIFKE